MLNNYKKIKLLHICDNHQRHNGRLFYSTGRKLQNGFILNHINCLNLSDRDVPKFTYSILDYNGRLYLLDRIKNMIKNFLPDIILIGHVDKLFYLDFVKLKNDHPNIIFVQWFLDSLNKDGPDFEKNKNRFLNRYQICDYNFITTSPDKLNFVDENKTFFIPNPIDPSIDCFKSFESSNFEYDLFIAISHGQHRGILKSNYNDQREKIINSITNKISINGFGYNGNNPIWGMDFFKELMKCKIGLNISRGNPIKYYSSDRISSLLGNGLLTFVDEKYRFEDFFNKDEIIFYSNLDDLNDKLIFYSKNDKVRIEIARKGHLKSHEIFNNKLITDYMIRKILNIKISKDIKWMN
tara:strand:+ start:299 stop:1354 length:1056 start_codon:yes stop_codon:yes gene_type:complete